MSLGENLRKFAALYGRNGRAAFGSYRQSTIKGLATDSSFDRWLMKAQPFDDGKLRLERASDDRKPLLARLNRIAGQVRGLSAMVEADRYCGDELQQIKAVISALRKVAILISEQHISAASAHLGTERYGETATKDITRILESALEI